MTALLFCIPSFCVHPGWKHTTVSGGEVLQGCLPEILLRQMHPSWFAKRTNEQSVTYNQTTGLTEKRRYIRVYAEQHQVNARVRLEISGTSESEEYAASLYKTHDHRRIKSLRAKATAAPRAREVCSWRPCLFFDCWSGGPTKTFVVLWLRTPFATFGTMPHPRVEANRLFLRYREGDSTRKGWRQASGT